ncbi:hypothetical protein HWV62_32614 [Athelia sp. TMB]|nr:hypothetical protein HWV62_32614 [Athelia sp. TMB]
MSTSNTLNLEPGEKLRKLVAEDPINGWDKAWQKSVTPWDRGNVQPPLRDLLLSSDIDWPRAGRALVPGCGRGYDPIFIATTLGLDTLAIDISPTAIKAANDLLAQTPLTGSKGKVAFRDADFFTLAASHSEQFDIVYDYTFFVAILPERRVEWGAEMNKLVKKGGYLITLVYPLGIPEGHVDGPPFRVEPSHYLEPLGAGWEKVFDKIPEVSFEANKGRERMIPSPQDTSRLPVRLQDMTRGTPLRLGLSHLTRKPATSARRLLHISPPCASAATLSSALDSTITHGTVPVQKPPRSTQKPSRSTQKSLRSTQKKQQKEALFEQLELEFSRSKPSYNRVWSTYMDLLHTVGARHIPLDVHERVLRACTPSTEQLRVSTAHRIRLRAESKNSQQLESRLHTVINSIETAGKTPTLEDYHVILAHHAAVGNHAGAVQLYRELVEKKGFEPQPKTYGLILQAAAHRLTLPCAPAQKPKYVQQTTAVCRDVLTEMWGRDVPVSPVNLDLAMRILKESTEEEAFTQFMRIGYGIDLDYPDRSPVEVLERQSILSIHPDQVVEKSVTEPQPFSTAALNTAIDTLGRFGNVSKLIQTFEVLTKPLPVQASRHFSHEFDEEDDDFGIANPASTPVYRAPHAEPNTTTYNLLIKHISRAGHAALARHYLQEAMYVDRVVDRAMRSNMRLLPGGIPAPHNAVNKGTIISVFGLANREKDMQLMRWVGWVARQTLRRKQNDLAWYSAVAEQVPPRNTSLAEHAMPPTDTTPSSSPPPAPTDAVSKDMPAIDEAAAIFSVDLDATSTPSPPPVKTLDLSFHIQLLQRDINQLSPLCQDIEEIIARSTQRVKERLGRRVWAGKDVFFLHKKQREMVPRTTWSELVHFKDLELTEEPPRNRRRQTRNQKPRDTPSLPEHSTISTSASADRA